MSQQAAVGSMVERARQMFFVDGVDPGADLAPYIHRSWRRCAARPPSSVPSGPLAAAELLERREAAAWLRQCAQPELDGLAEHALQQGCVVILSDATGLILDRVGSPDFLPRARRIALAPGVDWSEEGRGTNAIGTVLLERDALMVLGGEHYLARHSALGCAAAPVFDARGEIVGVLDISGESVRVNGHALGLVRMAASQLEHRMMQRRCQGQLLRFHHRPALLGTPREGMLALQDGIVVGASRSALALLQRDRDSILGASAADIFGAHWQRLQRAPGLVPAADGRQWAVTVDADLPASARPAPQPAAATTGGTGDALAPLLSRAVRLLAQGIPLVVTGETGSGKDVFVRRLHRASRRAAGPLVAVNCAALPDNLIEAELFGYEDGAFTGARRRGVPGRLRESHGGLLFLDEIGDMPLPLQTRLLRVLEERVVRPLGGQREIPVDFDLVCATHRDLQALVRDGLFRQDLLYRLQGYTVTLPALRDRPDRRALIRQVFLQTGAEARQVTLGETALDALERRAWPGNLRELASTLRSLVALAEDGTVLDRATVESAGHPPAAPCGIACPDKLTASARTPGATVATGAASLLAAATSEAVERALGASHGRVDAAARLLGIHRSTLYRQLARKQPGAPSTY